MHRTGIRARGDKLRAMSWEALTAISTAFTGLVILLTVIFTARQVRVLNEQSKAMSAQLDHLRRATQLDGMLAIMDELFSPELRDGYDFLYNEFESRMKDPQFRTEAMQRAPDPRVHKEVYVLRHFERIGTLVKNGLLDSDTLLDFACFTIAECWTRLEALVHEHQRAYENPQLWENFEFLARQAREWLGDRVVAVTRRRTASSPPAG